MKRIFTIALALTLMITAFAIPASAAEKPFLPDPGVYLDAQGEAYDSGTSNGESYVIYVYAAYQTLDNLNAFVNDYANDLAQLNYTTVNLDDEDAAYYAQYQHATGPAAELMILFNDDQNRLSNGEACEWLILLYVPGTVEFTLGVANGGQGAQGQGGQGAQGQGGQGGHQHSGLPCIPCGGTGTCLVCGGDGEASFGLITGPCIGCMGTGVCGICRGNGSF